MTDQKVDTTNFETVRAIVLLELNGNFLAEMRDDMRD